MLTLDKLEVCPDSALTSEGAEIWHYPGGQIYGYASVDDCRYRIAIPDIGVFVLDRATSSVSAAIKDGISEERVRDLFAQDLLPVFLQACGFEVLHASAVSFRVGVVAFCADSGAGKSTLAYALARRGHEICGDDFLAFHSSAAGVTAQPIDLHIRLRDETEMWFRREPSPPRYATRSPLPLAAVFILERGSEPPAVRLLEPAAALTATLSHAYSFSLRDPSRKRLMMENYLDLVAGVPVFRLQFAAGLDRLPEVLDAVERAL
jgi:hypothetical protein